ncbi:MAG TPA: PEGA domain-containing protein [Myxococcota bacterium]|nr:PEGA domain-containing protein [Myxococcota bacterium]
MKSGLLAALAAACLGLACAHYQYVGVETDPPGAQIYLDGHLVGQTPMQLEVSRDAAHMVYLKREGYRPEPVPLELHEAQDGIDFLTPADVVKRLAPGPSSDPELERNLKIEIDKPRE